ncbi:MAG: hypothetical protein L0H36_01235 [bacterium]|nr:hypothetical protein [bacterium]MDN5835241.1 hypothetical protein [bacterium]
MERLKGSDGKFIKNSELLKRWQESDGFDPTKYPSRLLKDVESVVSSISQSSDTFAEDFEVALSTIQEALQVTERLSQEDKAAMIVSATKDIVERENRTEAADNAYYGIRHEALPFILGSSFYVRSGRELARALESDETLSKYDIVGPEVDHDKFPTLSSVTPAVRSQVLKRLNEFELTGYDLTDEEADYETESELDQATVITYGKKKNASKYLADGSIETARMMSKFNRSVPKDIHNIKDVLGHYDKHNEERKINTVKIDTNADNLRVLPINELRLGHQDNGEGLRLVDQTVDLIKRMPEDEQPQLVTVSNIMQSGFVHHQAKKRQTLAMGLETENSQYSSANAVLDRLRELEKPVIVSLGSDDHAIAYDAVKDIIREMNGYIRTGGKENFISYYESNNLIQDESFQTHLKFYLENVIPLCYRMGRRLRTKDEVADATDGELNYSEYFALYNHIEHGEQLSDSLGILPEVIAENGEWRDGLCFVDDYNLEATTEGGSKKVNYRHSMAFSSETLPVNHMKPVLELMGGLAANAAMDKPDLWVNGRQQQLTYLRGALALPGLWDTAQSLDSKQYYATAPGDPSRRSNIGRRIPSKPMIDMYELTDDGRTRQSIISKEILDKADSLPRTALFELCDMQIGSPSARPDYQIMYLSQMLEKAQEMPIAIAVAGDIIHGHLYPDFPEESQDIGLVKLKSQKAHVKDIISGVFDMNDPVIRTLAENIIDVVVQPGNHDKIMRPKFPNNNDDNIDYLVTEFENVVGKDRVRNEAIFDNDGTPVGTWIARMHLGAYSVNVAHYHLSRGKFGNGGLPVKDAYDRVKGLGEKSPDLLIGAHWHNPQVANYGGIISVIGGPLAGQTNFEDFMGLKSVPAPTVTYLGGGEPMTVEFLSPKSLIGEGVKYGGYAPKQLAEEGFKDDPNFDPFKHGPYQSDDLPKSALMKKLNMQRRQASQLVKFKSQLENPNHYDAKGNPIQLNEATRRAFEIAARKIATQQ